MNKNALLWIAIIAIALPFLWRFDAIILLKPFQFLDELLGIFGLSYIFLNYKILHKNEQRVAILIFLLLVLGLISSLNSRLLLLPYPMSLDALACVKFFAVFIFANHKVGRLPEKEKNYIVNVIGKMLIVMICIAFLCAIVNLGTGFMSDERRKGLPCFAFLCRKSSIFGNMFYLYMFFLTLYYRNSRKKKWMKLILLLAVITWALTIRSRALLFSAIYACMFFWFVIRGKKLKFRVTTIILPIIMAIMLTGDRMEDTYSNEAAPRTALAIYGVKTMLNYFPLGSGFGTYGTDVACKYYSKLYYKYGFHHYYGLNPFDNQYAHDCYWPAIMAEYGVFGTVIVMLMLFFMYKEMRRMYGYDKVSLMLSSFLMLVLVFASLPTSIFFLNNTVFLILFMPLMKNSSPERTFPCKN